MTQPFPAIEPELAQLAERSGIALRYSSFWGEDKEVPEGVVHKALSAMGIRSSEDLRPGDQPLPATQVVIEGQASRIAWRAESDDASVMWRLDPQDAAKSSRTREGPLSKSHGECHVDLPTDLEPGYWRLSLDGDFTRYCLVIVAPVQCWAPAALREGERWWGCTIQLYALRSTHNWGIGDFGDLRRLVEVVSRQGASFIGLSPLHALFPHRPDVASPYSPSSRSALNPHYIDVQLLLDHSGCREASAHANSDAFQERLRQLRDTELVDYPAMGAPKEQLLHILRRHIQSKEHRRHT
jgi:(1->4)-alpha-D-glucan 1-alpha-D-glucosylmutase